MFINWQWSTNAIWSIIYFYKAPMFEDWELARTRIQKQNDICKKSISFFFASVIDPKIKRSYTTIIQDSRAVFPPQKLLSWTWMLVRVQGRVNAPENSEKCLVLEWLVY